MIWQFSVSFLEIVGWCQLMKQWNVSHSPLSWSCWAFFSFLWLFDQTDILSNRLQNWLNKLHMYINWWEMTNAQPNGAPFTSELAGCSRTNTQREFAGSEFYWNNNALSLIIIIILFNTNNNNNNNNNTACRCLRKSNLNQPWMQKLER